MLRPWFALPAFLLSSLILAVPVQSEFRAHTYDWPQWRGPDRTDVCKETGLLQSWPKDGPPLVWETKGLGAGYSAPSVAAGRIFGGGTRSDGEVVWALDEMTGKELWSTVIAKSARTSRGNGPRSSPTVDGDLVYFLGVSGDLVCLETASGKLRWSKSLPRDFNGRMMSGWGWSESPTIDGDLLLCTPGAADAALIALNKKTGDVIWKARVPTAGNAAYSSIVVAEVGGIRQYIQLMGRGVIGVAAKDGKFLWQYEKIANRTANIPTPIVRGDLVFCSTGYQTGAALLKLVPTGDGGIKAEQVYFLPAKEFQNHHGGMVLVGDYVYAGNGHNKGAPTCVEMKTGKVMWRQDRGAGQGSAAVLYADGNLYFRYQSGHMALVEATPKEYNLRSSFSLPDKSDLESWPHPVIANGRLYLRDQDILLCYDVKQH
jgi:outer membrane protein assembly factor BamB